MDKHTKRFNKHSIFGGKEPWRADVGERAAMKADVKDEPEDFRSDAYKEGFVEGIKKQKKQMMVDLIMGNKDDP